MVVNLEDTHAGLDQISRLQPLLHHPSLSFSPSEKVQDHGLTQALAEGEALCWLWGESQWEAEGVWWRLCGGVEGQGIVKRKEAKGRRLRREAGHCWEPGGR